MKVIGWVIGLIVFTSIWFLILTRIHRGNGNVGFVSILFIVAIINLGGYLVRKKLK